MRHPVAPLALLGLSACTLDIADVAPCTVNAAQAPEPGCADGTRDCDCDPSNGCEVDVRSDPSHCRRCGRSCLGGACKESSCDPVVMAEGEDLRQSELAVDDQLVYFVDKRREIMGVDKNGGKLSLIKLASEDVSGIAVDIAALYWTQTSFLVRFDKKSEQSTLAPSTLPRGIALDADYVYWSTDQGFVLRADKEQVARQTQMLTRPQNALWDVEVNDASVYALRKPDGPSTVLRIPKTLDEPEQFPPGGEVWDLEADAFRVYWTLHSTSPPADRVVSIGATFSGQDVLADESHGVSNPRGVVVDGEDVYFTTGDGKLMRVPASGLGSGEAPNVLATGQASAGEIAVDADSIYWLTDKQVMRLAR